MRVPKERIHYSGRLIEKLENRLAADYCAGVRAKACFKPHGVWYSAPVTDDGWEDWCRAEEFGLQNLAFRHRIELDLSKMLVLRSVRDLDRFTRRYEQSQTAFRDTINWHLVYDAYAGIEIAPYQWGRRFEHLWYYGWDCSSGVVWDLSAVTKWEPC